MRCPHLVLSSVATSSGKLAAAAAHVELARDHISDEAVRYSRSSAISRSRREMVVVMADQAY
jgi:hypothetical protein